MLLDDTRCGLDASSLHRATSIDISLYKNFVFSRVIETLLFLNKFIRIILVKLIHLVCINLIYF